MPKVAPDPTIDGSLDLIALSTAMHVCSTLDTTPTFAEVTAASLANVTLAPADFTKAAGDVSGRKVTVAAKSGVSVTASGTANHIALVTVTGSIVRYTTTCTSQALTAGGGNTVSIPAWKVEVQAP